MTVIEKIKAEIERLCDEEAPKHDQQCNFDDGYFLGIDVISRFIDSLQQEQPPLPSDSDEAAKEYAKITFKKPYSDNPDEEVTIVEPDKYAGFIAGTKWQKEQMMKEAVEGLVCATITGTNAISFLSPLPKELTAGDKVRIIILPKEDDR